MIKRWIITLFFCAAIVAAFAAFKVAEIKQAIDIQAAQPEFFQTIEVFSPFPVSYVPVIKTLGVALAPQQVTLRNELAGYITAVNFKSGATVEQGAVIIQLDVSEQEASLASAQAQQELARIVYERNVELRQNDLVDQESVDRSFSELNVIKANIDAIQSIVNRKTIRAPFTGVIGIHQFEPGAYLNVNSEITTLVGQSEEMWIDFSLSQFYGELSLGTMVQARLIGSTSGQNDEIYDATIIAGNSFISTEARSRLYRAEISSQGLSLLHNTSLEVEVPVGSSRTLLAVPSQAVRGNTEGQFVFVLDPEAEPGTYRARSMPVSIEGEKDGFTYVAGQLSTNDLVAAAGAFKLNHGLLVHANTRPEISELAGHE